MANPPRQKGTAAETELRKLLEGKGLSFVRTPASSRYDLTNARPDKYELTPLEVLMTRPDRGRWLATLDALQFAELLKFSDIDLGVWETHIECKRYARFSLHSIFESKFGRK